MEISLNNSKTKVDGHTAMSFYGPNLPVPSRTAAKSSLTCTGIFKCSMAGECMLLHWQLPTSAMAVKQQKIWWPAMIGLNKKGGHE